MIRRPAMLRALFYERVVERRFCTVAVTDRLAALQTELRRCGSDTLVRGDSILIRPISSDLFLGNAPEIEIQTYDDHRMAMAFSVLGLRRGGIRIIDPDCVSKSYPDFYGDLEALQSS